LGNPLVDEAPTFFEAAILAFERYRSSKPTNFGASQ
jgi:hypothetical protein